MAAILARRSLASILTTNRSFYGRAFSGTPVSAMSERHFESAEHAQVYSLFRPVPPASLVKAVVGFLDQGGDEDKALHRLAVDVGCGSGQSSLIFSPHFERVLGLDVSPNQVKEAKELLDKPGSPSNVTFGVGAEKGWDVEDSSAGLVVTCQAIHWFDIQAFYREADRVLAPGGTLAIVGYSFTDPAPNDKNCQELKKLRAKVYEKDTKPYWSPLREIVDARYTTLPPVPYSETKRDDSHYTDVESSLAGLEGYIQTWSGFQKYKKELGQEAGEKLLKDFVKEAKSILGEPDTTSAESIPLTLRTEYFAILARKPK